MFGNLDESTYNDTTLKPKYDLTSFSGRKMVNPHLKINK
jgi:hypothetical protein